MRVRSLCLAGAAVAAVLLLCAARSGGPGGLAVHEWGTFLTMSGSDGISLDGMYHEEHALPAFVHTRSHDQLRLRSVFIKGETPVIYFYTQNPQRVHVNVRFPAGIWTQWYPQAESVGPSLAQVGTPPRLANGHIDWDVDVAPLDAMSHPPALRVTQQGALWNYARDVDAAYVRATDSTKQPEQTEWERFLFYRGLAKAQLPVQFSAAGGGTVTCSGELPQGIRHIFVLRVENGRGAFRQVDSLGAGEHADMLIPAMDQAQPLDRFVETISGDLAAALQQSGLYAKEARAMVNTWKTSYFRTDGIRALFALPQQWTDSFIPLKVTPQPDSVVRVMVGRIELLTPARERQAESAIRDLASADSAVRERGFRFLQQQGRYVEPVVKRVMATTPDSRVRALCNRLLMTDYVTELRSAVNDAATGGRIIQDIPSVRAQLAAVLHSIGDGDAARAEARAALDAIQSRRIPAMSSHEARIYLRAYARSMEGLGDTAGAAAAYERFVRFGSQAKTCGGCHEVEGPGHMAFFRNWWAGRKYAEYQKLAGTAAQSVARAQAEIARQPNDTTAQLVLAYLYAGEGKSADSERMFAFIESRSSKPEKLAGLASLAR